MGNNPTKSQNLKNLFPNFSIHRSLNEKYYDFYDVFFVEKGSEVFMIKETKRQPMKYYHPNVVRMVQVREVDSEYYGLYEWVGQSVEEWGHKHEELLTREKVIKLVEGCVMGYGHIVKATPHMNTCLDIRTQTIRVGPDATVRVMPPTITASENKDHCKYRCYINDLGQVLRQVLVGKYGYHHRIIERKYGRDVEDFINMMLGLHSCESQEWSRLEKLVSRLGCVQVPIQNPPLSPNINKYTSQYPHPVSHHQHTPVGRSPARLNRTDSYTRIVSKVESRLSDNNSDNSFISVRSNTPIKTDGKERSVNLSPYRPRAPVVAPSRTILAQHNFPPKTPTQPNQPKAFINQRMEAVYPMFAPSSKNSFCLNHMSGVPLPYYQPKMTKDKNYTYEEKGESFSSQSTGTKQRSQKQNKDKSKERGKGLMETLLIKKRQEEQSSKSKENVLMNVNKETEESAEGIVRIKLFEERGDEKEKYYFNDAMGSKQLEISEIKAKSDSQSPQLEIDELGYEGKYEGKFHPQHPEIKHGQGRLTFSSGGSYVGNFNWNKMDGYGKLFYPSGRLAYEGYWVNNHFHGYGKLFNQNPLHINSYDYSDFNKIQLMNSEGYWKMYEGEMKNDMKEGNGVWVLENGEKYEGQFRRDMVDGIGVYYGKEEIVEGRWEENQLVEVYRRKKQELEQ